MNDSSAYKIYKNMLNEYMNVDLDKKCTAEQNSMFLFLSSALAELHEKNPINNNDPGYNEYEDMIYFYDIRNKNKPDCVFIKRFLYAARELCKLRPDNIFAEKETDDSSKKETNKKINTNSKKVFGVVPNDKIKKEDKDNDLQ